MRLIHGQKKQNFRMFYKLKKISNSAGVVKGLRAYIYNINQGNTSFGFRNFFLEIIIIKLRKLDPAHS